MERLYLKKSPAVLGELFSKTVLGYSCFDEAPDFRKDVEKQFSLAAAEWKTLSVKILGYLEELNIRRQEAEWDKFTAALNPLLDTYQEGIPPAEYAEIRDWFTTLLSLPPDQCAAWENPVREKIFRFTAFLHDICFINMGLGKRNNPLKESLRRLKSLFDAYSSLGVFVIQAGLCFSMASLLNEFQKLFLEKKRRQGVLAFSDVARLARAILRDYPEIRRNEKGSFKAIMIDEFQDNNELQKDLLFLLAEKPGPMDRSIPAAGDIVPDKLFFVGDEKQSVYRFRGADVSVFRGLKQELGAEALRLSINYRSSPSLIGAFNALFGGVEFDPLGEKERGPYASVFIRETGEAPPVFEAAYTPLRAFRDFEGKFHVCLYDKSGGDEAKGGIPAAGEDRDEGLSDQEMYDANENEAVFTAEKIKALLEETNEKNERKYRPEDIVILFRTHTPQGLYDKHLRLLNIP
jgi:ATP-dependent helicase/nuclease subunit A